MMHSLWKRAENNPASLTFDELQMLLNDRLGFVSDGLSSVSRNNPDDTLFDLMMLCFDSLNDKRETILHLWDGVDFDAKLICEGQSQLLNAINRWHEELGIQWPAGNYLQNLLFLLALVYTAYIWKSDMSADNSKVMAAVNQIIIWLKNSKSAPFDFLKKINVFS